MEFSQQNYGDCMRINSAGCWIYNSRFNRSGGLRFQAEGNYANPTSIGHRVFNNYINGRHREAIAITLVTAFLSMNSSDFVDFMIVGNTIEGYSKLDKDGNQSSGNGAMPMVGNGFHYPYNTQLGIDTYLEIGFNDFIDCAFQVINSKTTRHAIHDNIFRYVAHEGGKSILSLRAGNDKVVYNNRLFGSMTINVNGENMHGYFNTVIGNGGQGMVIHEMYYKPYNGVDLYSNLATIDNTWKYNFFLPWKGSSFIPHVKWLTSTNGSGSLVSNPIPNNNQIQNFHGSATPLAYFKGSNAGMTEAIWNANNPGSTYADQYVGVPDGSGNWVLPNPVNLPDQVIVPGFWMNGKDVIINRRESHIGANSTATIQLNQ